jgi:Tol biopolymer transport system component
LLGGLLGFGGPAQATFPGRNGRIAYSVGPIFPQEPPAPSQVFTINPDGSGWRQLTDVPADKTAGSPAWSPDGSRIANVSTSAATWSCG